MLLLPIRKHGGAMGLSAAEDPRRPNAASLDLPTISGGQTFEIWALRGRRHPVLWPLAPSLARSVSNTVSCLPTRHCPMSPGPRPTRDTESGTHVSVAWPSTPALARKGRDFLSAIFLGHADATGHLPGRASPAGRERWSVCAVWPRKPCPSSLSRTLWSFGNRGPLESGLADLRRAATLISAVSNAHPWPRWLCCDRILELILCRSSCRLVKTAISKQVLVRILRLTRLDGVSRSFLICRAP
ncbi:hypothetical protein QBC47DRAFT_147687 [Echria macrotheca]|uniref:Uncharacterized protein n=1 Tax=Echria macrotheca TaxID=438768 RepID=A0AAJ0FCS0_9PEZI|nr:hypothetical protein QBC47DRAFT_147687 [Echria macrotheca]